MCVLKLNLKLQIIRIKIKKKRRKKENQLKNWGVNMGGGGGVVVSFFFNQGNLHCSHFSFIFVVIFFYVLLFSNLV